MGKQWTNEGMNDDNFLSGGWISVRVVYSSGGRTATHPSLKGAIISYFSGFLLWVFDLNSPLLQAVLITRIQNGFSVTAITPSQSPVVEGDHKGFRNRLVFVEQDQTVPLLLLAPSLNMPSPLSSLLRESSDMEHGIKSLKNDRSFEGAGRHVGHFHLPGGHFIVLCIDLVHGCIRPRREW